MGCPPDPIDVSIGRGNDNSKALKEKAERLIPEAKTATQFFDRLCKKYQTTLPKEMVKKAGQLEKDASHFSASGLGQTFGYADFKESYSGYPDMSVQYSHLEKSEQYVKKIEINLCIARDLLLKAVALIDEKKLTDEERTLFMQEKALHLLHRKEDRALKLKNLENDISTCKFVISTTEYDYSQADRDERAKQLQQLEPEYQRVLALTDEELLQSRDLF